MRSMGLVEDDDCLMVVPSCESAGGERTILW